jgi:hypothetical protein
MFEGRVANIAAVKIVVAVRYNVPTYRGHEP